MKDKISLEIKREIRRVDHNHKSKKEIIYEKLEKRLDYNYKLKKS